MVGIGTIITISITLFICLLGPVIVWILFARNNKEKKVGMACFLGAVGFFVSQIVIRTPLLGVMSMNEQFMTFATNHYVLYCLILAVSAALFEVVARYVVAKIICKNMTFEHGIMTGLGHGGIEAILLVGMTYLNNLLYVLMINAGVFDNIVEQTAALGEDTSGLLMLKDTLIQTNPGVFLLAGYERLLTVILHVALSLLVCWYVKRGKDIIGIGICLVCHCLVDFVAGAVNGLTTEYMGAVISTSMAYVLVYIFLTAVAIASVIGIRNIRKQWV